MLTFLDAVLLPIRLGAGATWGAASVWRAVKDEASRRLLDELTLQLAVVLLPAVAALWSGAGRPPIASVVVNGLVDQLGRERIDEVPARLGRIRARGFRGAALDLLDEVERAVALAVARRDAVAMAEAQTVDYRMN